MTRGDIYLVKKPGKAAPKRGRAFVVVSRQVLIYSTNDGLVSIAKSELTDYVGSLGDRKLADLSAALKVALAVEE